MNSHGMILPSFLSSFPDARNKPSLAKEESFPCEALEHTITQSNDDPPDISISLASSIRINSDVRFNSVVWNLDIPLGRERFLPNQRLVRDGPANHVRSRPTICKRNFSNESHSWWRSCVEEQCECFNFRGYTINSGFCLWDIFIKTCVRAFETCRSRIACIPLFRSGNWRKSHSGLPSLMH
ncbi:hypothetical protein CEXT_70221 [Caerostris extrusa]|uniref:Uncharacterized protein n=1 Tax=Caerostris extrusa TaxID=172846 RepID=A0AAV4X6R6_CAEEX|nr:hypothetical protein CEXT_70221 [Caerostris extrusa]